jgi:aspartyl-tRNA(Asn)/glutamyl-tRNA(Gln) amidotransferase subunit C
MITKEQIQHLARLARLQLTDQELEQYAPQLDEIVAFVGQIQKVSLKNVDQGSSTGVAPLRIDKGTLRSKDEQEDLLSRAPVHEGNFIKTQGIFED